MQIVGIDPGNKGAIAIIDCKRMKVTTYNMPIQEEYRSTTTKRVVDAVAFNAILRTLDRDAKIVLEDVFSMPTDGHVGAFTFGMHKGAIVALVRGAGFDLKYITPIKWKSDMAVTSDKNLTKQVARGAIPGIAKALTNEGKCEAFLIALHTVLHTDKCVEAIARGRKQFQVG